MVAESEKDIVPGLQLTCHELGVPVVGGIYSRLLVSSCFTVRGFILFCLDEMPEYILSEPVTSMDVVDNLCNELLQLLRNDSGGTLFLQFDAMVPNIASILDYCYLKLADRVSYSGVNAGSETFQSLPCLFDTERIEQGGLLAVLLAQDNAAQLEHGYLAPEKIINVTSSEGNKISSIDWKPAFEVYKELIDEQYGVSVEKDNFYSIAVNFPLGLIRASGEVLVRFPVSVLDDSSLLCAGEVPEYSVLTILHATDQQLMDGVMRLVDSTLGPSSDSPGLTFYCAARLKRLGEGHAQLEINALAAHVGDVTGAVTLGEIGTTKDGYYPVFHNGAIVHCGWV